MGLKVLLERVAFATRTVRRTVLVQGGQFRIYAWHPRTWELPDVPPLSWLLDRVQRGDVVYDVGANRGYFSLALAAAIPQVEVIAFEPNPRVYAMLRANVALNGDLRGRVVPLPLALGDAPAEKKLAVAGADSASSFFPAHAAQHGGRVRSEVLVRLETLDSLVRRGELPPPKHIKIDTEGYEPHVLRGGPGVLRNFRPTIYAEVHARSEGGDNRAAIEEAVCPFGYEVTQVGRQLLCVP